MPNYDYECTNCHHSLEVFQNIKDELLKECPCCHSESLVRGIGGGSATFCFKGNGFYITDYKNGSSSPGGCGCSGSHTCG